MDVKDLRTESALSERKNEGSKYTQSGGALPSNRNKSYQDIGSNPLAKADAQAVRPCAVIGPDRVVPPAAATDSFIKKVTIEPWLSPENVYRRPPDYPLKPTINQNPTRNISPRQTFQENMQRIMVPPNYSALKHGEEVNYNSVQDRSVSVSKNVKPNVAVEAKYCDVPYTINTLNETKNARDGEMYVSNMNSSITRTAPSVWPPGGVNVHAPRTFGAPDIYQYSQYQSCAGPRPIIPVNRPPRVIQEEVGYPYSDHYYQDASLRYKPYPPMKERYPQPRYEYIGNYPSLNSFHPPSSIQPVKYDIPKSGQPHPYPVYPHLKYVENRVPDPSLEGYQRPTNQSPHYNIQFRNQVIHPTYAPIPGNIAQGKMHPYPPDLSAKVIHSNKLPFENSNKMYIDYENSRTKTYPVTDNYFVNEMSRVHSIKNQMVMPNYSRIGMPPAPTQQQFRKENPQLRPYEYMPHYRNLEHPMNNNMMMRHPPQFSPSAIAISPTDSTTSNETAQTQGTSQEDCGYVSQSSTASVRSIDSNMFKHHNEFYKRYDYRYNSIVGNIPTQSNPKSVVLNSNENKQINVRQFFQMWNEGEDDNAETNNSKEIVGQSGSSDINKKLHKQLAANQDQLYVLGLVNVPSEELSKYEHIQKISKLPENIKGYNNLELLSQFEEAIESSSTSTSGFKSMPKEYQMPTKENIPKQLVEALPRPVSPLDVEAKISQSVIHKDVGCNFEIRPCSPKMLNVEVATSAKNVLGERVIEKVTNPLSTKSPNPNKPEENSNCHNLKRPESQPFTITDNPSCKMIGSPYNTNNMDSVKTNYSLHDLEINSGVCLASLPRLDNEIELNFPEVNQQFINANKKDGNTIPNTNSQANLDEEANSSNTLHENDVINCENAPVLHESETGFTKLINYRKNKSSPVCLTDINPPTKAIRTDSVIIKNPENIKNIEEDKFLEDCNMNVPMNLSSQSLNYKPTCELTNINDDNNMDIVALDFSLNKPSNVLPIIDIEKDELTNSLTTKLPDTACENNSHTKNDIPDEYVSHTINTYRSQASKNNSNVVPEVHDTYSADSKQNIINYVSVALEDEITNSDSVKNEFTSILDKVYSENVAPANNLPEICQFEPDCTNDTDNNANNKTNDHKEVTDVRQACDSDDNVTLKHCHNINDIEKDITLQQNILKKEDKIRDTLEEVLESTTENEFKGGGDTVVKLCQDNSNLDTIADNQAIEYYKNKNLMETDEISATLEKIFEGTSDALTNDVYVNDKINKIVTQIVPIKTTCHQSKRLYSPWIQKLLLNEGLCTSARNVPEKDSNIAVNIIEYSEEAEENNTGITDNAENMELDDTIENTDTPYCDKMLNEAVVNKVPKIELPDQQYTSSPLFSNRDHQFDADKDVTTSSQNEISNENESEIQLEEKQSECAYGGSDQLRQDNIINLAGSKMQTNIEESCELECTGNSILNSEEVDDSGISKLRHDNNMINLSDSKTQGNDDECCELQRTEKSSLNSEEVDDSGISINDVYKNTTSYNVEEKYAIKQLQDQFDYNSVEPVAQISEESLLENTKVLENHEKDITEKEISELDDNKELESCESGVKCKNTRADIIITSSLEVNLNDDVKRSEGNQNVGCVFENEQLDTKLDDHIDKVSKASNIVCEFENIPQENSSISENISCDKADDGVEHNPDKENIKQNANTSLDDAFESSNAQHNDERSAQENHHLKEVNECEEDGNNISQLNSTEDILVPFLNCDNSESDSSISENGSCEKSDMENRPEKDEENLKQNANTSMDEKDTEESSNIHSEEISAQDDDLIEVKVNENQGNNAISQVQNSTEGVLVPFLNCENTESDGYQVVISEQVQTDDLASGAVDSNIACENSREFIEKHRLPLKRSYSDSDLHRCRKTDSTKDFETTLTWSSKRQKIDEFENSEQSEIAGKLCSIIQNSRRNSVSTFYNEENVSFCILIDNNCIITEEEGEDEKICFAEIEDDCITEIHTANEEQHNIDSITEEMHIEDEISGSQQSEINFSDPVHLNYETEKSFPESWLNNVACVETVVSDDIEEEVICSSYSSPKDIETMYISENSNYIVNESIDELSLTNEGVSENICQDDSYRMSHNITYDDSNTSYDAFEPRKVLYKDECLERIISESNSRELMQSPALFEPEMRFLAEDTSPIIPEDKENIFVENISLGNDERCIDDEPNSMLRGESHENEGCIKTETSCNMDVIDDVVHSCESSVDNVLNYKIKDDDISYTTSSSPEVSSTTSEEKSSSLVLKITNYNGSRVSQINEINHSNRPRCKFTEKKEYSNTNGGLPNRPLLTKGAQKYIPPLKESISDLKVKLSLPQQKLIKLKQLKLSKIEPKTNNIKSYTIPKKPKPNFEDVLKNIDELQIKMHKEKSKKTKPVPKVVIKKGHNGSHYTSSSNRDAFNPDLTGRKWQPWVFLEKNNFIDKMVLRNKTKAIFSHRQNTYVLAEKFKKYKSISSAKFVITHPNVGDSSKGQLKYTIRLKHTY